MTTDNTHRFSDRVSDYVKFRPTYPPEVIRHLEAIGLGRDAAVADVGAGTGIFTELLLQSGATVYAVEPNGPMRASAEQRLRGNSRFHAVAGGAENTTLPARSIDLVTAAQAFHWFDPEKARAEFQRILRPGGQVALIWNNRETDATPFLRAYEAALRTYGIDYLKVSSSWAAEDVLKSFYRTENLQRFTARNEQCLDLDGVKGRLLSASYCPKPDHPNYAPIMKALEDAFQRYQEGGEVRILYKTDVFFGPIP